MSFAKRTALIALVVGLIFIVFHTPITPTEFAMTNGLFNSSATVEHQSALDYYEAASQDSLIASQAHLLETQIESVRINMGDLAATEYSVCQRYTQDTPKEVKNCAKINKQVKRQLGF